MRSVLIVTRQPEIARLASSFSEAGMDARACDPDLIRYGEDLPSADLVVLDNRDLDQDALAHMARSLDQAGHATLLLVPPRGIGALPVDLAVDDMALMPVDEAEVAHRVARILWRRFGIDNENVLARGPLTVDLANYRVTVDGVLVALTFKEYELLRFLAMNPGQAFSRQQLLDRVWGYDYYGGARTVDVHIRRIRAKIETGEHIFIETIRNVGYRLTADAPEVLNEAPRAD